MHELFYKKPTNTMCTLLLIAGTPKFYDSIERCIAVTEDLPYQYFFASTLGLNFI